MTDWLSITQSNAPLIVSIPHAGTIIPDDVTGLISHDLARRDADHHVDRLYAFAADLGATIIHSRISRTVIDLNRDPSGQSLYPGQATTGLCSDVTFDGEPLYAAGAEPDAAEIERRRACYFGPYHTALCEQIERLRALHPVIVLYDAHSIRSRVPRLFDGELPQFNIGSYNDTSCDAALTDAIAARAMAEIVLPTIREMARRGTPYQGVLYAGLMIKDGQGRLVEYNARFGDPETQVLMMRLGAQALDLMLACAEGRLDQAQVNWAEDHAITVVMAAKGYPGSYQKGSEIRGLARMPEDSRHMVFHAGTTEKDGRICANGGRVLNITARGDSLAEARNRAYAMIDHLDWPEGFCRSDIGWRAL
jgi:N-formylglutamate amidohydrolase